MVARRHIFTMAVAALLGACAGNFDPDLGDTGTTAGTSDGSTGDGTGSTGDGTGSTDDTGSSGETGVPDGCGDGEAKGDEECDGLDLRGMECTGLAAPTSGNFHGGSLACAEDCTYDTSSCFYCGDGEKNGSEQCDGEDFGGATCESEGLGGGDLACDDQCQTDDSACGVCEGDPMGKYGHDDTHPDCEYMQDVMGEGKHWMVCLPSCDIDDDCGGPEVEACGTQPTCENTVCLILCEGLDENCPAGMVCVTYGTGTPYCAWEV